MARYADLFTRAQHAALREAEEAAPARARPRTALPAARGVRGRDHAPRARRALRRARERDPRLPGRASTASRFRCARRRRGWRCSRATTSREQLGQAVVEASAGFNPERLELMRAAEALEAELSGDPDPISRSAALTKVRHQRSRVWGHRLRARRPPPYLRGLPHVAEAEPGASAPWRRRARARTRRGAARRGALGDTHNRGKARRARGGLVCVERFDRVQRHASGGRYWETRKVVESTAYEQWRPGEQGSFIFEIPRDAPYSWEGECVSYAWRVSAREVRPTRENARLDRPIWVRW